MIMNHFRLKFVLPMFDLEMDGVIYFIGLQLALETVWYATVFNRVRSVTMGGTSMMHLAHVKVRVL